MPKKSLYIEDLGEIDFYKHKRAKYLRITVKSCGKIRVTVPYKSSYSYAQEFVLQKIDWIKNGIEKAKKNTSAKKIFDENTDFKTRNYNLKIIKHAQSKCDFNLTERDIEFYYPKDTDIADLQTQNALKKIIIEVLRKEAKEYLPKRVEELAKKHRFNYRAVFIKKLKTRWGSCSSVNNINLNLHLMRLPDHLIDYVLLHELAHTKEKNHGKNFWNLMNKLVINLKELKKELKNYSIDL